MIKFQKNRLKISEEKFLLTQKSLGQIWAPENVFGYFGFLEPFFNQNSVNHENFFVRFPTKMSQNFCFDEFFFEDEFFLEKKEFLIFSSYYLFSYTNRCTLPQLTILDFNTDNNGVSLGKDTIR